MNRIGRGVGLGAVLLSVTGFFAGCGSDDDGGSKGRGSFASIEGAIESPSGTVDASTAPRVGVQFEKLASVDVAGGMRRDAQTAQAQNANQACTAGGSIEVSGSGSQSSGEASIGYDNCCVTEGCCIDGDAHMFYSSEQDAAYAYCADYDLGYDCDGTSTRLIYQGCFSLSGEQLYVIEVDGETYTVSGNYSDGSGTLEISGINGTWTCTYTEDGGSCTGSSGSFDF